MSERIITDVSQDEKFSTFIRRLFHFKRKGESDEEFARRIGVPYNRLKGWKYRSHTPQIEDVIHIADVLDVCVTWLALGHGHRVEIRPDNVRLTEVPREPLRIYEDVESDDKKGGENHD